MCCDCGHGWKAKPCKWLVNLVHAEIPPANLAELRAANDELEGGADVVVMGPKVPDHRFNQRLVGKLHAAAEGIAEELAAELAEEVFATGGEQMQVSH